MLLACGGGLFLYNAAAECIPRVVHARELKHKLGGLALFVVGAASIGLVLLDHKHCD
jgi:hypothetical protein